MNTVVRFGLKSWRNAAVPGGRSRPRMLGLLPLRNNGAFHYHRLSGLCHGRGFGRRADSITERLCLTNGVSSGVNRSSPVSKTWIEPGKSSARRPTNLGERLASKRSFNATGAPVLPRKRRHRRLGSPPFQGTGSRPKSLLASCRRLANPAHPRLSPAIPGCTVVRSVGPAIQ